MYNVLFSDIDQHPNHINWVSLVKDLLSHLGFQYVWLQQGVGNETVFLSELRQRLTDNFVQNWNGRLQDSSRAICYKNISDFGFKQYLECVTVKKFRNALLRLRTSSHRLEIESGRWARPTSKPIAERLCFVCNKLEDEYHFVLECPVYNDLRCKYIKRNFWRRPNMLKFIDLLTSDNKSDIKKLACYVQKAFALRTELLYRA